MMVGEPSQPPQARNNGRVADTHELPEALVEALGRLRRAEAAATGANRRAAWRDTGQLLAAALELGYGAPALATHIGTTASSVRSRARGGDWLTTAEAGRVLDVAPETLQEYAATDVLPAGRVDECGLNEYHRRDVLMLLIAGLPQRPTD